MLFFSSFKSGAVGLVFDLHSSRLSVCGCYRPAGGLPLETWILYLGLTGQRHASIGIPRFFHLGSQIDIGRFMAAGYRRPEPIPARISTAPSGAAERSYERMHC